MKTNILVCGNGPSCEFIDFTRVPKDSKVMRTTMFYSEEKYNAGKRVDYYVDYAKRLVDQYFNIRTINEKGEYEIDMENTWWTVLLESNPHFPTIRSCTEFIQKTPLIAEFRCFYEYYYGQYLPTGMQALALAVVMGFENIFVAGFDLYSDPNNLHAFPELKDVHERMNSYNRTSIYDTTTIISDSTEHIHEQIMKTHPTSMQIKFINLLSALFPSTKILSVCNSSPINEHILLADAIYETPWYQPLAKPCDRIKDWLPLPESMPSRE